VTDGSNTILEKLTFQNPAYERFRYLKGFHLVQQLLDISKEGRKPSKLIWMSSLNPVYLMKG
jgi:hypothetical protein